MSVPSAEGAIRWSTIAVVSAVAGIAGWVSYEHVYAVVVQHGETDMVARVYPGTVDGLIYSASMVLLNSARRGVRAHPLARWLLGAGILATLAANVAAGLKFGAVGALVASWPALALVGSYELLMLIIRGQAAVPGEEAGEAHAPGTQPGEVPDEDQAGAGEILGTWAAEADAAFAAMLEAEKRQRERLADQERQAAELSAYAALPAPEPAVPVPGNGAPEWLHSAQQEFSEELAAGQLPTYREIRSRLSVGADRAQQVHGHFEALTRR